MLRNQISNLPDQSTMSAITLTSRFLPNGDNGAHRGSQKRHLEGNAVQ
jgi:hypothetical protein